MIYEWLCHCIDFRVYGRVIGEPKRDPRQVSVGLLKRRETRETYVNFFVAARQPRKR